MIEYVVLGVATVIFMMALCGTGLVLALRGRKPAARAGVPTPPAASIAAPAPAGAPPPPAASIAARYLLDVLTEIQREAAAIELVKALSDPENNPHIPSFLAAKKPDASPPAPPPAAPVPNVP